MTSKEFAEKNFGKAAQWNYNEKEAVDYKNFLTIGMIIGYVLDEDDALDEECILLKVITAPKSIGVSEEAFKNSYLNAYKVLNNYVIGNDGLFYTMSISVLSIIETGKDEIAQLIKALEL